MTTVEKHTIQAKVGDIVVKEICCVPFNNLKQGQTRAGEMKKNMIRRWANIRQGKPQFQGIA